MTPAAQRACDEALQRIAECVRRRSTVLDLSGLGLAQMPSRVGQLTKLTELNLAHNRLTSLPPELGQLAHLTRLDLSHNQIGSLPAELGQLASLTLLYLSHNPLDTLPADLGQLAHLTRLDLSHNRLATLPPALGQLANLTRLDLSNNRLAALPPALGRLATLTRLYLSNNQIGALPAELGQLAGLTRLYLSHNRLVSLPAELGQLARLTVLDLSNNNLAALPAELGGLANLTELDLDDNQLGSLPPELGELSRLTVLRVMANRLGGLPEALRGLEMLEKLFLHDNPGLQLSPSVLGPDPRQQPTPRVAAPKAILEFYFARQAGRTRPLNEVKLILLGRCGAGKTSIAQALRDLPFREREAGTVGIARSEWTMEGDGQPVTAQLWDCSGQPLSHLLHPLFFSARNLYVVVLSGRDHHEREDADYWLRMIEAAAADERGQGPPVLVALNQWNVPGCRPEVDRVALRERYPFIRGFVEMDCKAKKGIPALKAALCRELDRMPWVREPFPQEWDAVRRALAADGTRPFLSHDEFRALCVAQGVTDEGQQDYLAEVLHHLGAALNSRHDPRLPEATVLQPPWLTKHLYALLHRAEKSAGVLTQAEVDIVLPTEPDAAARAYLIDLLAHLGHACAAQTAAGGGTWLVPAALPPNPPAALEDFRDAAEASRLRYSYQSLPEQLVTRFAARRYGFVEDVRDRKLLWRSGVVLTRKGARVLIRAAPQDRQLLLTVIGPAKTRRQLADLCQQELRDLHAEFPGPEPIAETQVQGAWVGSARAVDATAPDGDTTVSQPRSQP